MWEVNKAIPITSPNQLAGIIPKAGPHAEHMLGKSPESVLVLVVKARARENIHSHARKPVVLPVGPLNLREASSKRLFLVRLIPEAADDSAIVFRDDLVKQALKPIVTGQKSALASCAEGGHGFLKVLRRPVRG